MSKGSKYRPVNKRVFDENYQNIFGKRNLPEEDMATRNFWLEAVVDGHKSKLTCGPQAKNGGFTLDIFQRSDGSIANPVRIRGNVTIDQKELILDIFNPVTNELIYTHRTKR